jgi:hypothetical protein
MIYPKIFMESTNKALTRKLKLDDLSQMITQGIKLKLFVKLSSLSIIF